MMNASVGGGGGSKAKTLQACLISIISNRSDQKKIHVVFLRKQGNR